MDNPKKQYFLKLNPPRDTFMTDMTEEEKAIMHRHVAYWRPHIENGTMIVMGPVFPPAGYGIGIIEVDSEDELNSLIAADPANGLNRYDVLPMRAVTGPWRTKS